MIVPVRPHKDIHAHSEEFWTVGWQTVTQGVPGVTVTRTEPHLTKTTTYAASTVTVTAPAASHVHHQDGGYIERHTMTYVDHGHIHEVVTVTSHPHPHPTACPHHTTHTHTHTENHPQCPFAHPKCHPQPIKNWTKFTTKRGPNGLPAPVHIEVDYPALSTITVSDDEYRTERYEVSIDGVYAGITSDIEPSRHINCDSNPEECKALNFSHGKFVIPPGKHTVTLTWVGKDLNWLYWGGLYKIESFCPEN